MTEYLIGMHNYIDFKKFQRDYNSSEFTGIEFCNFTSSEEIQEIVEFTKQNNIKIGIHFPLNRNNYKYRDPHLLSLDEHERKIAMDSLVAEIKVAKNINAEYILIHFPKPLILDKKFNWHKCNFSLTDQPIDEEEYPFDLFKKNAFELMSQLSHLSNGSGIQIVLEIELLNKYFYEGEFLKELLDQFSNIRICLDSARLNVQSKIDPSFNCMKFVKEMAPYTYLIHLSNIKVSEKIEQGHHPVLKRLDINAGWFDIDTFLSIISENNKDIKILYEHRSDIINDNELSECYEWVSGYFKTV
jgi:sugar phosphate isomerase/epimerase